MSNNFKEIFDNIPVSDKLDNVIKDSIVKAKIEKRKGFIKRVSLNIITGVASIMIFFTVGINSSLSFASTVNNVPIISSIAQALQFHYDKNIVSAVNQSDSQKVNQTVSNNNVNLTINSIVGDNKDKFILYKLKSNDKKIEDLLLDNFTITSANNVIVDSNVFRSQILPATLINQQGDFLVLNSSKDYKVMVSSLGDSMKNYAENGETYGSIEIIALDNNPIPDNLSLKVSSFTESYNMSYSQKKYTDFISKFNRKPTDINGNWVLNLNATSNTGKLEEYNNIKFSANNTDFQINYLKIYPTHIETNITLGINKINNEQSWSIGTNATTYKDNYSKLPYLIDENGNKYMVSPNSFVYDYANKSIDATFQSSYYIHPKHLYLIISQINYSLGPPSTDITPVKIQIK